MITLVNTLYEDNLIFLFDIHMLKSVAYGHVVGENIQHFI